MAQNIDDLKRAVPPSPSVATPLGSAGIRGRITGVTRIGSRAGLIAFAAVAALVFAIFYGVSTSGSHPHDATSLAAVPQVPSTSAPLYANIPGAVATAPPLSNRRVLQRPAARMQSSSPSGSTQVPNLQSSQAAPVLPDGTNQNALQNAQTVPDPRSLGANVPAVRVTAPLAVATPNAAAVLKAERAREAQQLADQARRAGILVQSQNAPTVASAGSGSADAGSPSSGASGNARTAATNGGDAALQYSPGAAGAAGATAAGQTYDPNVYAQRAKSEFISQQKATTANDYVTAPRQASISPYEVQAGSIIPATLLTGINSDLPGTMIGQVSQNVYDSKTGRYLLIPAGSKTVGRYDSQVTNGQSRVIVAWQRIIFPDASFIDINGMAGADTAGYSGLTGKVDDHSGKLFRNAILSSLIGAGATLLQPRNLAVLTPAGMVMQATAASQVAGQVATGVSQAAARVSGNGAAQQPTIEVRPGYLFNIVVDRDLVLPGPYAH